MLELALHLSLWYIPRYYPKKEYDNVSPTPCHCIGLPDLLSTTLKQKRNIVSSPSFDFMRLYTLQYSLSTPKARKYPPFNAEQWVSQLCCFISVILCLGIPKLIILAVHIGYKLGMSALLDDCALVEYCDLVAEFARG